jgi:hypothetical protein
MELDRNEKLAVEELGNAINTAIEQSPTVAEAIEYLRGMGFEPTLNLKIEIGLQEIPDFVEFKTPVEEPDLELTEADLRTLQRMKIII